MSRRMDTSDVGDQGEALVASLLASKGWTVANLNDERRNTPLHDLRASKGDKSILISVKHARAKRHVRLGRPTMFRTLRDEDFVFIVLPRRGAGETNLVNGDFDLWIVPGSARHQALESHIHYYHNDLEVAFAQSNMMIKDKVDTPGGRSKSGAVFHAWERAYKDAWHMLPS